MDTPIDEPAAPTAVDETVAPTLPPAPISEQPLTEQWRGDARYFQSGKKAGQLKPSAGVSGIDSEQSLTSDNIEGIDADKLRATVKKPKADKPKQTKAEKQIVEGKIAAALVMRALDVSADYISGGELGQNYTPDQTKARLQYREQLQADWEAYLSTLDIPLHPALVVAFGSIMYVAPAFATPKGETFVQRVRAKIAGWWVNRK